MQQFFEGQPHHLPASTAYLSSRPGELVVVQEGCLDVYSTALHEGAPTGMRRYLFSLGVGEALFGLAPNGRALLALAVGETTVRSLSVGRLAAALVSEDPTAVRLYDQWLQRLSPTFLQASAEPEMGEKFEAVMAELVEVAEPAHLVGNLTRLHGYFLECLGWLEERAAEQQHLQMERRERRKRQAAEAAMGRLLGVLAEGRPDVPVEGTPLMAAASRVGQAVGLTLRQPGRSEDLSRIQDPLEAIARASRVRVRRVELSADFDRKDCGPLLCYRGSARAPVALLSGNRGGYALFDPDTGSEVPLSAAMKAELCEDAYMFYRPLPERKLQVHDLVDFALQGRRWDIAWMLGAAVCAALLGTIAPIITGLLVDLAIPQANRGLMLQMGLGLLVCTVASAAFGLAQSLLSLRVESLADATTQAAVWDRVLSLKPLFFRGYASGDLNARIMGITEIRRRLSGVTLRSLFSGFFSLVNLGFMFACSPSLTWIALGLALVVVVVTIGHGRLKLPRVKALQKIQGEIFGLTVQLINGIAKLRVAGAEERAFAHWAETYSRQQKLNFDIQFIEDSLAGLTQVLPLISSFLIFWCTYALLPDRAAQATGQLAPFSLGAFLAFNAAFNIFIRGVASLSTTVVDALDVINLWERALPILEAEPEVNADSEDPGRLGGRLALEKLSFRYVKGGPLILDHLSIHAEPGEFIALVGDSGCGKSTIFRLLLGFETPEAGSITYDNQDLSRLDVRSVRRQLGVVLQNGKVQAGSIFQNIAKGAVISLDEAWEAARLAGLEDDIRRMPMGMNTVVSEGGGNISGGQRQRLLIAQALCLRPSVLLLDEATSALDNRTQSIVSESLARLQVTRVVVAHRLSTIRSADRIYVLQRGRIVQQGRYEELIAQEGLFAQLASRQLA